MKKSLFLIFLSAYLIFDLQAQTCDFFVTMFDTFGDTWNGASLVFKYDGTSQSVSLENFVNEETQTVSFPDNVVVTMEYVSGDFDNEVRYELYDNLGQLIFSDGPDPAIGDVLEFVACGCQITTPTVIYYDHREIWLSWNTVSTPDQRQIIEYGERDFMLGAGTVKTTRDSMIVLDGLDAFTEYDIYFTSICLQDMDTTTIGPIQWRTRRTVDGGIRDIEPLESGCDLDPIEFGFNIINYGGEPLTLVPVFYSINDRLQQVSMPQDGLYTGLLGPDSADYFFFDNRYSFPEPGDYEIAVWTEIDRDEFEFNDTTFFTITNSPIIDQYPYFESYEEWSGGWYPDTIIQEHSMWTRAGALQGTEPFDGPTLWRVREDVDTENDILASLISPCFDFSGLSQDPIIKMALYSDDFVGGDHVLLFECTKDGGENWETVQASPTSQNWYSRSGGIAWDSPLNASEWSVAENIAADLAGEGNVQFRLRYYRAGSGFFDTGDGWQIDAFEIIPRAGRDLAINLLDTDFAGNCGSEEIAFDVRVRNLGEEVANSFSLFISQDGGMATEFSYSFPLAPNTDTILNFVLPISMNSNLVDLDITLEYDGDQEASNNQIQVEFEIFPVEEVPYFLELELDQLPEWDFDSSENILFDFNQFFVESKTLDSGERWEIVSPSFGPIEIENDLQLEINWTNEDLEYVTLEDQDSICIFISTDCFETQELIGVFTSENYDPTVDGPLVTLSLEGFEGMTANFIILFKNNGMSTIVGSINQFNIRSCHLLGLESQISYNSHPDSTDASVQVQAVNGNPPYSYEWSNSTAGPVNTNLPDGTYMVTITDSYGCELIEEFEVRTCPEELQISFEVIEDEGGIFNNGEVRIQSIEGDLSDYEVEWSNGFYNVDRIENLGRERYRLKITNEFGCEYNYVFDFTTTNNNESTELGSSLDGLVAYPNPTRAFVSIDLNRVDLDRSTQFLLLDHMGRVYEEISFSDLGQASDGLKMGPVKRGINFLMIKTNTDSKVFKIIGIE